MNAYKIFMAIAVGRSKYSTFFLLVFMVVAPAAVFIRNDTLEFIAWLMLCILGLFVTISGIITFKEAQDSHLWPKALANVKKIHLSRASSNNLYAPVIECTFEVDGKTYNGTLYDFSSSCSSKSSAEQKLEEIQEIASTLMVYYKPSEPSINVIKPGVKLVHYLRLLIGPIMMIIAILSHLNIIIY